MVLQAYTRSHTTWPATHRGLWALTALVVGPAVTSLPSKRYATWLANRQLSPHVGKLVGLYVAIHRGRLQQPLRLLARQLA